MRGKTKRRSRGGFRQDCGVIDGLDVSDQFNCLEHDEFPSPRANLSIKGCSIPTVRTVAARPVFDKTDRLRQSLQPDESHVNDLTRAGSHTSIERVSAKRPNSATNFSTQYTGAEKNHGNRLNNPIFIPTSETLDPSPSSTAPLTAPFHPSSSTEHDKHARHQRLTALANKLTPSQANQQSFVDELDNINANLLAEQQKTRDMSIMLGHAREEIDRLNRHLNYRGGQVTDLQQAVQAERNRVTEMCLQREEYEANILKLMAENRSIKATDLALREKCRTMEEELDDAEDQCRFLRRELEDVRADSRVQIRQPQVVFAPASEEDKPASQKRKTPEPIATPKEPPAQQSPHKRQGLIASTDLSLSPEPPMGLDELRAFEDAIYQADSAAQQEAFLADLKAEIQARGLAGMGKEERRAVLARYG